MASTKRALHYVFKIADRANTVRFYRDLLGMTILRHEEFDEGCKAACNGPYDGVWSKSMVGYGNEDNHFVIELTYNYGIKSYKKGSDFQYIGINSKSSYSKISSTANTTPFTKDEDGSLLVNAPGGYSFKLYDKDSSSNDPVQCVCISVSNLSKSLSYWSGLLGMTIYSQNDKSATLGYSENQAKLLLNEISQPIDRGEAYGRIAFSCPRSDLPSIEATIKDNGHTILTPLVSLDTPGKATVEVVILADPDGHEICFVGDEAFRELSQIDPIANTLMDQAIEGDTSDVWFAEKEAKRKERRLQSKLPNEPI